MKARSQTLTNCRVNAIEDAAVQESFHEITSLSFKVRATYHAARAYKRVLRMKVAKPLRRVLDVVDGFSSTGSPVLYRSCILLYDLMNALSRKVKLICNSAQRFPTIMHFKNLEVSLGVRLRAWAKRAPLPILNSLKRSNLFSAQLPLATALTKITNPRAERIRLTINNFNVRSRDSAMAFARREVLNGCNRD